PPSVLQARADHAEGRIDATELRAIEDDAIREVVQLQEDLGLQTATDGEFRRTSWHMDFIYQLDGIHQTDQKIQVHFRNTEGNLDFKGGGVAVGGRIGLDHTILGEDFAFLKSVVTRGTPKLTIPSPSMVHYRGGPAAIDRSVYPDDEEFWSDLSAAYAEQVT